MDNLKGFSFEIGAIRPPSEGGSLSLLLRMTRNCPWNRCGFCYGTPYNHQKFELRTLEEIKADIDSVKGLADELKALSWKLGYGGKIQPLGTVLQSTLNSGAGVPDNFYCIVSVFNWLCFGGKTAFLQDADTLIMRTGQLAEAISYLKGKFPSLERITSYARSKTVARKKLEELSQLRQAGLSRLHIGLETGDDELLVYIDKGVTSGEQILAGRKAMQAGFELSEYFMPGLGGKKMSRQHATNTARVLNEINPDFIRSRPFVPRPDTPMFEDYQDGRFELTSPYERLREIRMLVENLEVTSHVCFDHNLNPSYWSGDRLVPVLKQSYEGYHFPEEKATVLGLIDQGLGIDEAAYVHAKDLISQPL